jgi:hypothetical protein
MTKGAVFVRSQQTGKENRSAVTVPTTNKLEIPGGMS